MLKRGAFMNSYEKAEIQRLDSKYRPLGAWEYFGYTLLFSLPLIGFICLLIFCFSDSNINRRSFARSYFCGFFIVAILAVVLMFTGFGASLLVMIQQAIPKG